MIKKNWLKKTFNVTFHYMMWLGIFIDALCGHLQWVSWNFPVVIDSGVFPVSPSIVLTRPSLQYQVAHIRKRATKKYWCGNTHKHAHTLQPQPHPHITAVSACSMRSHVWNCLWYIKKYERTTRIKFNTTKICLYFPACVEQEQLWPPHFSEAIKFSSKV